MRTVLGVPDGRVGRHAAKEAPHLGGPRQRTQVPRVEFHHGGREGVVARPPLVAVDDGPPRGVGQPRDVAVDGAHPQVEAGGRAGDDEVARPGAGRDGGRVRGAQHAAPRVADEVEVGAHAQAAQQVVELGEEERAGPEGRIARHVRVARGAPAADLVVQDQRPAGLRRDGGEPEEHVLVVAAGPAVDGHEGPLARTEVAQHAVPGLALSGQGRVGEGYDSVRVRDGHGSYLAAGCAERDEEGRRGSIRFPFEGCVTWLGIFLRYHEAQAFICSTYGEKG